MQAFCDEVTVLRHGRLTGEGQVCDLTPAAMGEMMMGTAVMPDQAARESGRRRSRPAPWLVIDDLTAENEIGVPVLRGLSLQVRPHEIVGIAGVSGNGQRELVQVLAGQREASGGRVCVHGQPYRGGAEGDAPAPLPRPAGDAATERLRADHDDGGEPGVPPLRQPADDARPLLRQPPAMVKSRAAT